MRAMESNRVTENKEQVALKVEQLRGSQPSGSGGKEQPSKSVKKESWYEMTMQDAQEQEASRSMIKREVFEEGSERDGRDSFCFRGSNQSGGLESNHGSRSGSEDRATSRW
jgi:hypothetical protein